MTFKKIYGKAQFIQAENIKFPYFRKNFYLDKKISNAKLTISALGFCEIYLNGKKITNDLYITPFAEYNKRFPEEDNPNINSDAFFGDDLSYTVYVNQFSVDKFVKKGDNCFGVVLAGGWYRSGLDKHKAFRNYGKLKLCFSITVEYDDGTSVCICSNELCKCKESFLINAGIFHEDQDERKEIVDFSCPEYDDSLWQNAVVCEAPDSKFLINDCPPNRVVGFIKPKLIKTEGNTKIYALPRNITGYPVITGESVMGDIINCVYGETLNDDLSINDFHSYCQNSQFISDGRKEHYLRFTWHGFQYFSIKTTGDINKLKCEKCALVYADIKNTSDFNCNLSVLNFLYSAYIRCQNENFQCGVPTDCPQIERKGYTGDGQLLCECGLNLFDSKALYRKWMRDISDVQDRKTGFVHNTAPCFIGCSGGLGGWGMAIINVPYQYYKTYGDISVLRQYFCQMKKYAEFLYTESVDGLVQFVNRKATSLGDWAGPVKPYLPTPFVNTCLFVEALYNLAEIADVLNDSEYVNEVLAKITYLKTCIDDKYYDDKSGDYCGNVQASNAFAINIGLGDERTLKNLVKKYKKDKFFDTGIFGTKLLIKTLFEKGYGDEAIDLLCSKNKISYYSWMKAGATTLWEAWENPRSLNHPMFGSPVIYLFRYVLGIKQVSDCGYNRVKVSPMKLKRLKRVRGYLTTENGVIKVSYSKTGETRRFIIDIPEGVSADFEYEGYKKILANGKNVIEL